MCSRSQTGLIESRQCKQQTFMSVKHVFFDWMKFRTRELGASTMKCQILSCRLCKTICLHCIKIAAIHWCFSPRSLQYYTGTAMYKCSQGKYVFLDDQWAVTNQNSGCVKFSGHLGRGSGFATTSCKVDTF